VTPYSPLARGFVAGNRTEEGFGDTQRAKVDEFSRRLYFEPHDFAVVRQITQVAEARGVSNAQVALAWLLHQPGVIAPIVGATELSHLEDSVGATRLHLEASELAALGAEYRPHPILMGRR
jgi:aryl-alcohol dehydrogenase-like predicted oxidoreductase